MRRTRSAAALVATVVMVVVIALSAMPAGAAVVGGGSVVGNVTIGGSGIPTLTEAKAPTSYTFAAINIIGTFRSNNGGNFAGLIKIPAGVTGGSPGENTLSGKGSVNSFSFSGTTSGNIKISGTCSGKFNRTLSIVIVNLNCSASVGGKPAQAAKVTVAAQFTPTSGNGITTRVKKASFAGIYIST
jgi:hypothetical protein